MHSGATTGRVTAAAKSDEISVISVFQTKPIPRELIRYLDQNAEVRLMVVEDGVIAGGFGEKLYAELQPRKTKPILLGYGDHFVPHGAPAELESLEKVSTKSIEEKFFEILKKG